jgi:hypothetical protein
VSGLDGWRKSVQRNDQLKEETVPTATETRHPSWCVPSACSARVHDGHDLIGVHSTDPVSITVWAGFSVNVSVAQFLGNFGSVMAPGVQMWADCQPAAWMDPDAADQLAAVLTAAAERLRAVLASGDYIPPVSYDD